MEETKKEVVVPDMDIQEIPFDIVEALDKELDKDRRIYPCNSNRASELGHPCIKFLVLKRTRWEELIPPDMGLMKIFGEGNLHEKDVSRQLCNAGIEITHQQIDLCQNDLNITGHIDGQLVIKGLEPLPVEIKSTNPYDFDKVKTVSDMVNSPRVWWQKYPGQMTLYLHLMKKKLGVFLLKNKLNGAIKQVFCKYDPVYAENLLEKARIINEHVKNKTLPDPIMPDENICGRCGFLGVCAPNRQFGTPLSVDNDGVLEDWLKERESLKQSYKRYNEIHKNIKNAVEGQENILVGDYHITGKFVKTKGYEVKPGGYWGTKILYVGKKD